MDSLKPDIDSKYVVKKSEAEKGLNESFYLWFGLLFFFIPLLVSIKLLIEFNIFSLPISLFFTFVGFLIAIGGIIARFGDTFIILNGQLPITKYVKIGEHTILKKNYSSMSLVKPKSIFPELPYPASVMITRSSDKGLKISGSIKSTIRMIKSIKEIAVNINNYKYSNNFDEIFMVAILYLWSNNIIYLVNFKSKDYFLGLGITKEKDHYIFLAGDKAEQVYKSRTTGIIEKSILSVLNNKTFDYEDNDLRQLTKKIIATRCNFPERLFPDMARNQGIELGLYNKINQEYNLKEQYKDLFEISQKELYKYIQSFESDYPEFFIKFRDDINTGVKSMDNGD